MSNEYSVQIHDWITRKLEEVHRQMSTAEKTNDKKTQEYLNGKLEELLFFRQFLAEQIDLKTQTYY